MTAQELVNYLNSGAKIHLHYKDEWINIYQNTIIHSKGADPQDVLLRRHLQEPKELYEWRIQNNSAITTPAWRRAAGSVQRILQDSMYQENIDIKLQKELEKKNYQGMNFWQYFQQVVLNQVLEDPNGFLVWMYNSRNQSLYPIIVNQPEVVWADDEMLFFLSNEEGQPIINPNGDIEYQGDVWYQIDKNGSQRWIEKRIGNEDRIVLDDGANHIYLAGENKYLKLGGYYRQPNVLDQFFQAFIPSANEVIRQFSDWQAIMSSTGFPVREVQQLPCGTCEGTGTIRGAKLDEFGNVPACHTCNGSGIRGITSPFQVIERPMIQSQDKPTYQDGPMIRFSAPPVDIIAEQRKAWEKLLDIAEQQINLKFINESQQGVAKAIDREELYAMLNQISINMFDELMQPQMALIQKNNLRQFPELNSPVIHKPQSFRIKDQQELLEEFNRLSENAPLSIRKAKLDELNDKMYSQDDRQKKIQRVLQVYDPMYMRQINEKIKLVVQNIFQEEQFRKSEYALNAINIIVNESKGNDFVNMRDEEIMSKMDILFNKMNDATKGQINIESSEMMNGINQVKEDIKGINGVKQIED